MSSVDCKVGPCLVKSEQQLLDSVHVMAFYTFVKMLLIVRELNDINKFDLTFIKDIKECDYFRLVQFRPDC
jgi:hypothetical protein